MAAVRFALFKIAVDAAHLIRHMGKTQDRFLSDLGERVQRRGFHFDRQSSTAAFPCFSKPLTADWQLSWGIEDPGMFHIAPTYGDYDPFLVLRNKRLKGAAYGAKLGEFVRIRYQHIVPGFSNAYWKFFSLAALATCIKAHLFLYGLMAPLIEKGIKHVLGPDRD